MRTLAVAKPNKRYRWYQSISSITLEARLLNNRVVYYEIDTKPVTRSNGDVIESGERRISIDEVEGKFLVDHAIKKQPFLVQENKDFYAILNRHRIKYKQRFIEIKNKI